MIVFLVCVDIPLPLLLEPDWDKLAVGVVTEREVELLTEPSEAVTTTTVVDVEGVALAEVDEVSDVVAAVV